MNRARLYGFLTLILLASTWVGCFAGVTGGVTEVVAAADRSDPVQLAVADVLATADQGFAPILGAPYSATERETMIRDWTKFQWASQGQSSMDLMRMAEAVAATARHVNLQVPGGTPLYYEQQIVKGNINATSRMLEIRFGASFEDRKRVAADLVARLAPLFSGAANWHRTELNDPSQNPVVGTTSYVTYLSMGMDASSEVLMVSVDYYHDRRNHEAMRGVRILVNKQSTRVD